MSNLKKINGSIQIVGRKWFQTTYGNTYHSVMVYVNDEKLTKDFEYGYGNQYVQTAHDLLKKNGYDVPENYNDFMKMLRDTGSTYHAYDVKRKRDLAF